jgi:threonylcarbamoyladenosine tRNA methylthiotransferase MtaB
MAEAVDVTFALAVLGCRANQEELDALRSHLLAHGAREVPYPGPADLTIVNTCAVTASAQAQSRQEVRRARPTGSGSWPGILIATGCGAQLEPATYAGIAGCDLVAGNAAKSDLPALIDRLLDLPPEARQRALERRIAWTADPTAPRFLARSGPIPHRRTRALLKVQDGCDGSCTFCIVRVLRGRPISRDRDEVLAEARHLAAAGFREIVVTGVNLGLYAPAPAAVCAARGPAGERLRPVLGALLDALAEIQGIERIRLSSLEPMTISAELIAQLAANGKIARALHIPIQSGDDETLRRMGRPYTAATLRALAGEITRTLGTVGLGVDVMAGFPGETEAAFARTLALIEELPVTYVHAFAYSERPGTPAASFPDAVPPPVRKQRVLRLRELDARLRRRFQERLKTRPCRVLVERSDAGVFEGYCDQYVRMRGQARQAMVGQMLAVIAGDSLGARLQQCDLVEA